MVNNNNNFDVSRLSTEDLISDHQNPNETSVFLMEIFKHHFNKINKDNQTPKTGSLILNDSKRSPGKLFGRNLRSAEIISKNSHEVQLSSAERSVWVARLTTDIKAALRSEQSRASFSNI